MTPIQKLTEEVGSKVLDMYPGGPPIEGSKFAMILITVAVRIFGVAQKWSKDRTRDVTSKLLQILVDEVPEEQQGQCPCVVCQLRRKNEAMKKRAESN